MSNPQTTDLPLCSHGIPRVACSMHPINPSSHDAVRIEPLSLAARLRWICGIVQQDLAEGAPERAKRFLDHQLEKLHAES